MDRELTKISKFLSLILRHKPETIGIKLDDHGWAYVKDILIGMKIDKDILEEVVSKNNKQRFAFNDDHTKIRANQGHSLRVDLDLKTIKPPDILYHGTNETVVDLILNYGITKRNRQSVHLSENTETAIAVGKRRGKPVVLKVNAGEMHEAGYRFFLSENKVWLTDYVPPNFINI